MTLDSHVSTHFLFIYIQYDQMILKISTAAIFHINTYKNNTWCVCHLSFHFVLLLLLKEMSFLSKICLFYAYFCSNPPFASLSAIINNLWINFLLRPQSILPQRQIHSRTYVYVFYSTSLIVWHRLPFCRLFLSLHLTPRSRRPPLIPTIVSIYKAKGVLASFWLQVVLISLLKLLACSPPRSSCTLHSIHVPHMTRFFPSLNLQLHSFKQISRYFVRHVSWAKGEAIRVPCFSSFSSASSS